MTIAGRINLLITSIATVVALLFVLFLGQREFNHQLRTVTAQAESIVRGKSQLPIYLYFGDGAALDTSLERLMDLSDAVKRAVFFNNSGDVVAQQHQPWAAADMLTDLSVLREGKSPMDSVRYDQRTGTPPSSLSWLAVVLGGERNITLSIPIVSATNPTQDNLSRADFARAIVDPAEVKSLFVSGFGEVTISATALRGLTLPTVGFAAIFAATVVVACWLFGRSITRRITAPLGNLAAVAEDIATGRQTQQLRVRGSGEIRQITEVLNGVIVGLNKKTQQMDADKKILNMKVSERTSQLSEERQKLSKAEQNASAARDKLRHLAYFDSLTGLPNRRLFAEQLSLLLRLASRNADKVGLLFINIDNFKRINDSLGTEQGDELLRQVAFRLQEGVRESDVLHRSKAENASIMDLSRMGGDEFTVVLNKAADLDSAALVAERLGDALAQPFLIDRQEVIITASSGITIAPDQATDVESLLRNSRTAMLRAKRDGRNRAVRYDGSMESANRERLQLENELRRAAEKNQLLLHYQPQVHGQSGQVVGAEALVRWKHPARGLVPPYQWIPLVEELGIIDEVGEWVLREACRTLVSIRKKGLNLPKISVNVSALQFHDRFIETVDQVLKETGLSPSSLELELTEGIIINDQDTTVGRVQRLKDLGVRLSIDDFGTGYSSLSYLTRFPLDELKIDRSFVLGIAEGQQSALIVRAIIAMAKSLELDIVVEGVEHPEELQFFRDQDVHVTQGFLFSPPVPEEKLAELLQPGVFLKQLELLDRRLGAPSITVEKA
ncbi:MAG: EAL domain-containing protein [Pseudomonadota bacterium]